jgi:hypothetical protein
LLRVNLIHAGLVTQFEEEEKNDNVTIGETASPQGKFRNKIDLWIKQIVSLSITFFGFHHFFQQLLSWGVIIYQAVLLIHPPV